MSETETDKRRRERVDRLEKNKSQGLGKSKGLQNTEAEKERRNNYGKTGGLQNTKAEKERRNNFGKTGGLQNTEAEKERRNNFGKTGGLQNTEAEKERRNNFGKTGGLQNTEAEKERSNNFGETGGLAEAGPLGVTNEKEEPEGPFDTMAALDQALGEKEGDYERDLSELGQLRSQTIADTSMPQADKEKLLGDISQQPAMQKKQARIDLMSSARKLSEAGKLDEAAQKKLFEQGAMGKADVSEEAMRKAFTKEDLLKDAATEKELAYLSKFEGPLGGGLRAYDTKVRLAQQERAAGKPFVARNKLTGEEARSKSITSPSTLMVNKAAKLSRLARAKGLDPSALVKPLLERAAQLSVNRPSITTAADRQRETLQNLASAERAEQSRDMLQSILKSKRDMMEAQAGEAVTRRSILDDFLSQYGRGGAIRKDVRRFR